MNGIRLLFPFTLKEVYGLFYGFLLVHGTMKLLSHIEKRMESQRRRIIRQHVKEGHKDPLRRCLENDCAMLSSL